MILVIVGFSYWDFKRLVQEMDNIAGNITEDVVIQLGNTKYIPKNAKFFKFVSNEVLEKTLNEARVIVAHAGVGTIIDALNKNKKIIIVPRYREQNEHLDNHQVELAKELEKDKNVTVIWDIKKLADSLMKQNIKKPDNIYLRSQELTNHLKKYINESI